MNLIDRYIYAVTRHLPEKQRLDIEKELRTLIDDMMEQQPGNEPDEKKVQKVLIDLGDPALLADSYRERKRYLIGPQNFDNYLLILKIVSGAVFLGISIATVIDSFFSAGASLPNIIANYIATLLSGVFQGFAWVTGAFAIAEYNGYNLMDNKGKDKNWSLRELPEVPQKAAAISRVETAFSIIFSTIFTSILYFAPQLFAAYFKADAAAFVVIPVFNIEVLSSYKLMILVLFVIGITKEVLKLISGRWTLKLSTSTTLLSIISMIVTLSIFSKPEIWNNNFTADLMRYADIDLMSGSSWISFTSGVILVIVFATVIEIVTTMYKGIKYNTSK